MHSGKDAKALLLTGAQCTVLWLHVPTCAKKGHLQTLKQKGEQELPVRTRG